MDNNNGYIFHLYRLVIKVASCPFFFKIVYRGLRVLLYKIIFAFPACGILAKKIEIW